MWSQPVPIDWRNNSTPLVADFKGQHVAGCCPRQPSLSRWNWTFSTNLPYKNTFITRQFHASSYTYVYIYICACVYTSYIIVRNSYIVRAFVGCIDIWGKNTTSPQEIQKIPTRPGPDYVLPWEVRCLRPCQWPGLQGMSKMTTLATRWMKYTYVYIYMYTHTITIMFITIIVIIIIIIITIIIVITIITITRIIFTIIIMSINIWIIIIIIYLYYMYCKMYALYIYIFTCFVSIDIYIYICCRILSLFIDLSGW